MELERARANLEVGHREMEARDYRAAITALNQAVWDLERIHAKGYTENVVDLMVAAGTALVVWYGARRALAGHATPGDLIVFTAYLRELYNPVSKFSELIMDVASAFVCGER